MRLLAVLSVCVVVLGTAAGNEEGLVVDTDKGRVEGIVEETLKGRPFFSFLGIPYARPPTGTLRFKDPVPSTHWMRVWKANKMPSPCLQPGVDGIFTGYQQTPQDVIGSENCLYLNVYTPTIKAKHRDERLPVMVFIHGGGFLFGSAEEYLPHVLLDHQIVLVVMQYRLGVMGFLSTEDEVMPGNMGLKDQTLALQWVQNNIQKFGGDKTRVTIFGESAGGASVHLQMLAPSAKGLFSRVIMQSGTALSSWNHYSSKMMKESVELVKEAAGCTHALQSKDLLSCLQEDDKDGRTLTLVAEKMMKLFILPLVPIPRVDGDYLPDHPAKLVREGHYHKVDLMAGIAAEVGGLLTLPIFARSDLVSALENQFSSAAPVSLGVSEDEDPATLAKKIYEYYLGDVNIDADHADQLNQMFTDVHFGLSHDLVTQYHARHSDNSKHPTFRYNFNYRGNTSYSTLYGISIGKDWVVHADDLLYLFVPGALFQTTFETNQLETPQDIAMKDLMTKMWVNFAATGHPTPDDSLGFTWDPSTADHLTFLEITPKPTMRPDSNQKMREFHASLNTKMYQHLFHTDSGQTRPDDEL
ncbi:hypothetical protein Pcinc_013184 [Petrolisthes cinctipes]|uniref:Carboxylic ester hydrolase n=1 Tax=Petrolisthes cinctipes TaxID=88211 RepID=A0AAE1FXE4_PETCI|nr:hypothetical protein Pcinc_013184 [Petrolisthes cinctipes]